MLVLFAYFQFLILSHLCTIQDKSQAWATGAIYCGVVIYTCTKSGHLEAKAVSGTTVSKNTSTSCGVLEHFSKAA